jgi:hypothetical protein
MQETVQLSPGVVDALTKQTEAGVSGSSSSIKVCVVLEL